MRSGITLGRQIWLLTLLLFLLSTPITAQSIDGPAVDSEVAGVTNPTTIVYQGNILVGSLPHDGPGYFKFAIVSSTGPSAVTYWSNDGTSTAGSQPAAAVLLQVNDGYFTVPLGNTSLSGMTQSLTPSVFSASGRYLRVWFGTTATGFFTQLGLVPFSAVPYALNAETLDGTDSDAFQKRVVGTCSGGSSIRVINADGSVVCETDDNATYSAGTGLSLSGGTFSVQFSGSGTATTAARSNHNHWGASWSGSGLGMTLQSTDNYAAYLSGSGGLRALGNTGIGVSGQSESGYGIYGVSRSNYGIFGTSTITTTSTTGVYGVVAGNIDGTAGVKGYATSTAGNQTWGVYGRSYSSNGAGVEAHNWLDGVGLRAHSFSGNIIEGFAGDPPGGTLRFRVDNSGNMYASGSKSAVVETADYETRRLYAVESPEVWFEDFGTGQLVKGEATIYFDPIFAQTVNLTETYHIFLTPISEEAVLLFVTQKQPVSFTVRGVTLDGTPAVTSFDYRIVAKRMGYENVRLELDTQTPPAVTREKTDVDLFPPPPQPGDTLELPEQSRR
ncbi:MAG: hypothetical protein BWY63_02183 [Chloroflexi bacterium ADurb.Bin360]|nr:MAG: hypothetical protein BWY63_02183 [Chloroflexi bacterium ADurb.Bin360]